MTVEAAHIEGEFLRAAIELADGVHHLLEGSLPFQNDEMGFSFFPEHIAPRSIAELLRVVFFLLRFFFVFIFKSPLCSLFFS